MTVDCNVANASVRFGSSPTVSRVIAASATRQPSHALTLLYANLLSISTVAHCSDSHHTLIDSKAITAQLFPQCHCQLLSELVEHCKWFRILIDQDTNCYSEVTDTAMVDWCRARDGCGAVLSGDNDNSSLKLFFNFDSFDNLLHYWQRFDIFWIAFIDFFSQFSTFISDLKLKICRISENSRTKSRRSLQWVSLWPKCVYFWH